MEVLPNDNACLLHVHAFSFMFFFVFVISIGVQEYTKNTFWLFKTNNELTCNYDRKITEPE